ncbi:MAG: Stp1/IreP family PP2C-type Ser/Thr phosphatase [Candidatus Sericytochromatia bacterium]|nr:Stp1/IreP family PP2C-type Ser/Thr phosphatase [Candidatus Sericytochromatia bacterium]
MLVEQLQPIEAGTLLADRYRIERFLEFKHGSNIYRAVDTITNLVVIVKEQPDVVRGLPSLEPGEWAEQSAGNPYQGEFLILRSVSYPTVVKALDILKWEGRAYLVIEQLEGRDLGYYVTQHPVTVQQSLEWMIQLCQSISQLHRRQILHLDLHPRCIVVAADNQRVRLTGFHRAVVLPLAPEQPIGSTPGYSAPEQCGLVPGAIDARADIYALGAVWFQLLTGLNPAEHLEPDWQYVFPAVSEALAAVHPQIARVVARMLDPEPEGRFSSINEVKNELLELVNNPHRRAGHFSDVGMVREGNEDSVAVKDLDFVTQSRQRGVGLYMVADGMGGVNAGEVAAALAIEESVNVLEEHLHFSVLEHAADPGEIINQALTSAIKQANLRIYETGRGDEVLSGMGTTLTIAVVYGQTLYVGHVGDSRAYVINRWGIEKVSRDHSLVGRLVEIGQITEDEALVHPQRNLIYRALGTYPNVEVDTYQRSLKLGDWVLLCSDGLTGHVKDPELQSIVLSHSDPQLAAQHLVNTANLRGGEDNISVVVVNLAEYT